MELPNSFWVEAALKYFATKQEEKDSDLKSTGAIKYLQQRKCALKDVREEIQSLYGVFEAIIPQMSTVMSDQDFIQDVNKATNIALIRMNQFLMDQEMNFIKSAMQLEQECLSDKQPFKDILQNRGLVSKAKPYKISRLNENRRRAEKKIKLEFISEKLRKSKHVLKKLSDVLLRCEEKLNASHLSNFDENAKI